MSPAAAEVLWSRGLYLAVVVGLYIVGVTWLARTEARVSSRAALIAAARVMGLSLLMALPLPVVALPVVPPAEASSPLFPYLLVGLGFFVGFPVVAADPHADAGPRPVGGQTLSDGVDSAGRGSGHGAGGDCGVGRAGPAGAVGVPESQEVAVCDVIGRGKIEIIVASPLR